MENTFFVYILQCSDSSYYTGYTCDLKKRIELHNKGKAAKYTIGRRPVTLVYFERLNDKSSALSRERQIKGWKLAEKEELIKGNLSGRLAFSMVKCGKIF